MQGFLSFRARKGLVAVGLWLFLVLVYSVQWEGRWPWLSPEGFVRTIWIEDDGSGQLRARFSPHAQIQAEITDRFQVQCFPRGDYEVEVLLVVSEQGTRGGEASYLPRTRVGSGAWIPVSYVEISARIGTFPKPLVEGIWRNPESLDAADLSPLARRAFELYSRGTPFMVDVDPVSSSVYVDEDGHALIYIGAVASIRDDA